MVSMWGICEYWYAEDLRRLRRSGVQKGIGTVMNRALGFRTTIVMAALTVAVPTVSHAGSEPTGQLLRQRAAVNGAAAAIVQRFGRTGQRVGAALRARQAARLHAAGQILG